MEAKGENIEAIRDSFNRGYEQGKQTGIKEVVEWINIKDLHDPYFMGMKFDKEWQSKLKEWGIEK